MACSMCLLRNPFPWIIVLAPFLLYIAFVGCGFSSLLFITLLVIFSSVYFTFSKHKKPVLLETHEEEEVEKELQPEKNETKEEGEVGEIHGYLVSPVDSFSESESIDLSSVTDQDSEADDWPYSGGVGRSPDCSEGSISDEESLIEIALPSGQYVSPDEKVEEKKFNLQQKNLPELMELFSDINEVNEEDNLIEIDISMGSIKGCSRFEIEA